MVVAGGDLSVDMDDLFVCRLKGYLHAWQLPAITKSLVSYRVEARRGISPPGLHVGAR